MPPDKFRAVGIMNACNMSPSPNAKALILFALQIYECIALTQQRICVSSLDVGERAVPVIFIPLKGSKIRVVFHRNTFQETNIRIWPISPVSFLGLPISTHLIAKKQGSGAPPSVALLEPRSNKWSNISNSAARILTRSMRLSMNQIHGNQGMRPSSR